MKFYFFALGSQNSKFPREREKKKKGNESTTGVEGWQVSLESFLFFSLLLSSFLFSLFFLSFSEINTSKYVLVSICFYSGKYFIT